jgi:peptidyl-prolyl cis-trans isomerase B (cyclophilin B)
LGRSFLYQELFVASNKEIKAQAAARKRAFEAKQQLREQAIAKRKNDNKFALVLGAVAVVIALAATYGHSAIAPAATASATAAASASATPAASATSAAPANSDKVPSPALAENRTWAGSIQVNGKKLWVTLDGAKAPQAVANFISLAKQGFYSQVSCHRLTTAGIYVLQCGDPKGDGTGGPGYSWGPIENAPADNVYKAGVLAMARQGGNGSSMGSQFFIVYKDSTIPSDNAGGYTVFGNVLKGMDTVNKIAAAGVAGGSTDGKPAVETKIGAISLK